MLTSVYRALASTITVNVVFTYKKQTTFTRFRYYLYRIESLIYHSSYCENLLLVKTWSFVYKYLKVFLKVRIFFSHLYIFSHKSAVIQIFTDTDSDRSKKGTTS
jgi:hypothetical protein